LTRKAKINAAAKKCAARLSLPLLVLAALPCLAAPAQAARVHQLLLSETPPGERSPTGIAVNQSTHHFYVSAYGENGSNRKVFDFEANGQLTPTHPELIPPATFAFTNYLAVDNSGGPSNGYVYVQGENTETKQLVVQQFNASGEATAVQIGEGAIPANGFPQIGGLPPVVNNGAFRSFAMAVDGSGDLYVVEAEAEAIDVFDPTGAFVRQAAAGEVDTGTNGLALDATGNIYLANTSAPEGSPLRTPASPEGAGLFELDPSGECVPVGCAPIDPEPVKGAAIDQARGAFYAITDPGGSSESGFREYELAGAHSLLGAVQTPDLKSLFAIGVNEDSGEIVITSPSVTQDGIFQIYGPVVIVPDVVTLPPTGVGSTAATLNGEIGAAGLTGATCVFQYVTQEEFKASRFESAQTAPCQPEGPFSGEEMHAVHADILGLKGGTKYHQRILGTNANGENPGEDITFETTGPTIAGSEVAEASETAITLKGTVNPNGSATEYRIQYLTQAQFEASGWSGATEVPLGGKAIGAGTEAVPVSQTIEGLAPGTAYRFRILATSSGGESTGEEVPFATYAPLTTGLPDGRRYEQASPVDKNGANVQGAFNAVQAALNGSGITFFVNTGIPGGEGSQEFPTFMASRAADGSGWSTQGLLPPASYGPVAHVLGWTEELTDTYDFASQESAGALLRRANADGSLTHVATTGPGTNSLAYAGSSSGGAVALLESSRGGLLPGALSGRQNLYAYDRGRGDLVVAGVLNDGSVPPGGAMAGPYNWFGSGATGLSVPGGSAGGYTTQASHAISADGSKVFFTAGGTGQLFVRLNPFAAQSAVDGQGACTEAAKACTVEVSAPASGVTDPKTPAAFVGASADGNLVYFLDQGKLTADATGGAGYDLYRYDLQSGDLTDLTLDSTDKKGARVEGVLGMGQDGEDVYLVAAGALNGEATQAPQGETNLYALHGTSLSFLTRMAGGGAEELNWLPGSFQEGTAASKTSRVSEDGGTLLLRSGRQLTGYRNHGVPELYLHRQGGGFECVSCNPTGEAPSGPAALQDLPRLTANLGRNYAITTRNLSADGRRVIFDTPARLVAGDRNQVSDVYEWEEAGKGSCAAAAAGGCLSLISGGAEGAEPSYFADADEEGENVFFFTAERLVAQDRDQLIDVYDARVGGGIAAQEAEPLVPCESPAGCRGAGPGTPNIPGPVTPSFSGPGNPKPPKPCKRGYVRRHGRCVAKHHPHKKHKRKQAHGNGGGR